LSGRGTLFLVVGPSGAGKDSLIAAARDRLPPRYVFPQRTITRPREAGGEDHLEVSTDAFERLERERAFALSWRAHGLRYGIPASITAELAGGRHVVINVSREIVPAARRLFSPLRVIEVTAPLELRAARLRERGRESEGAIGSRLARTQAVEPDDTIVNNGLLETAVAAFLAALTKVEKEAPGP
jgi:phosphonate metabolism protein PhnN/1,5-bisphosphokinase (PRPP-forming)